MPTPNDTPETPPEETPTDPPVEAPADEVVEPVETVVEEVTPEPAPETPAAPATKITVVLAPDALDGEFDEAIKEIEADDMLSPSNKRAQKLALKVQQEERNNRRHREAVKDEEEARDTESKRLGVSREDFDKMWGEAWKEAASELGSPNYGAAKILLNQKIKAAKTVKPAAETPAAPRLARTTTTVPPGARLSPPGGGVARTDPKAAKTPEEEFSESIANIPVNQLVR